MPALSAPPPDVLAPLPHAPRYPLLVDGVWRSTCKCHYWQSFALHLRPIYVQRVVAS